MIWNSTKWQIQEFYFQPKKSAVRSCAEQPLTVDTRIFSLYIWFLTFKNVTLKINFLLSLIFSVPSCLTVKYVKVENQHNIDLTSFFSIFHLIWCICFEVMFKQNYFKLIKSSHIYLFVLKQHLLSQTLFAVPSVISQQLITVEFGIFKLLK